MQSNKSEFPVTRLCRNNGHVHSGGGANASCYTCENDALVAETHEARRAEQEAYLRTLAQHSKPHLADIEGVA